MSVSHIPRKIKIRLWVKSAGRCQYRGCNKPLYKDDLTQVEFNSSYIAHIIANKPAGPRGDKVLSEQLKNDISNLMILCDVHHRLIDIEDEKSHSVETLKTMKKEHEDRVEIQTSISKERRSHILLYGANIGKHISHIDWNRTSSAMVSNKYYPAEKQAMELSLKNSSFKDSQENFWSIEKEHLKAQFQSIVWHRIFTGEIEHISVFALAPMPLLILLGTLLSDLTNCEVYQLHREPADWTWQDSPKDFKFLMEKPEKIHNQVALNLSLSADITNDRILKVLGKNVSIWNMRISNPNNDFLKGKEQLSLFRKEFRFLLNEIKKTHGEETTINLFLAVPVAVAVEIGRTWMPKADLPFLIYDQNTQNKGFFKTFRISNEI